MWNCSWICKALRDWRELIFGPQFVLFQRLLMSFQVLVTSGSPAVFCCNNTPPRTPRPNPSSRPLLTLPITSPATNALMVAGATTAFSRASLPSSMASINSDRVPGSKFNGRSLRVFSARGNIEFLQVVVFVHVRNGGIGASWFSYFV